jgi:hypothetical protein
MMQAQQAPTGAHAGCEERTMGFFKKIKSMAGGADSELLETGRLGRGVVVGLELTGTAVTMGVDEYRVCQIAVQVFLDGEQPYVAQARQRILEYQIPALSQGGALVAVRVDPANPQNIAIDFQSEPPVVTMGKAPDGGAERILQTGVPAELVIVANAPLGVRNHLGHEVHLFTLTVSVPGQAPYQVQVGNPVPAAALPLLYPGSKVPGKVMAGEPNSVAIDWDAAIAAQS